MTSIGFTHRKSNSKGKNCKDLCCTSVFSKPERVFSTEGRSICLFDFASMESKNDKASEDGAAVVKVCGER